MLNFLNRQQRVAKKPPLRARPQVESLSARVAPAAGIIVNSAHTLAITGTSTDDHVWVFQAGTKIHVRADGTAKVFERSAITRIVFNGNMGDDVCTNSTSIPMIANGGVGDDTINGGSSRDSISGGIGDDSLHGKSGDDSLVGDAGDDSLVGGIGHDREFGGSGNDDLSGGSGNDFLQGDSGNDRCRGDDGNDDILGNDGDDSLVGGLGNDSLHGHRGRDHLDGSGGIDFSDNDDNDTESEIEHRRNRGGSDDDDDTETEFKALLSLPNSTTTGRAEAHLLGTGSALEVKVFGARPATTLTVLVNGTRVGSLRTNSLGKGEMNVTVTDTVLPGETLSIQDGTGATILQGVFA